MVFRALILAAAALLAAAPARDANASVMVEASVPELARQADLVARGKVLATESKRSSDGKRIYTTVTLEVREAWKGQAPRTVEIHVPGGTVDGIAQVVQGAPRFEEGEDVVVFLRPVAPVAGVDASVPQRVVAMAQGKLRVARDESGVEVAVPDLSGLELVRPGGEAAAADEAPRAIRVADLEAQVRATLPAVERDLPDAARPDVVRPGG